MPTSNGRPRFFLIDATQGRHRMSYEVCWPGDHRRDLGRRRLGNDGLHDPTLDAVARAGLRVLL